MAGSLLRIFVLLGLFSLATLAAKAQEVVHAVAGTVNHINLPAKTITVITDDDSEGTFKDFTTSKTSIDFEKKLRAEAIAADAFKNEGAHVIVYYFGDGDVRTAVALQNLGPGPLTKSIGTVVKFSREKHLLTIQDQSGAIQSFKINGRTVAETGSGAVEGLKFEPDKGDRLRVTATKANGSATALFINAG
jgi:hypothetical protein